MKNVQIDIFSNCDPNTKDLPQLIIESSPDLETLHWFSVSTALENYNGTARDLSKQCVGSPLALFGFYLIEIKGKINLNQEFDIEAIGSMPPLEITSFNALGRHLQSQFQNNTINVQTFNPL